jgi:hypothetical protein
MGRRFFLLKRFRRLVHIKAYRRGNPRPMAIVWRIFRWRWERTGRVRKGVIVTYNARPKIKVRPRLHMGYLRKRQLLAGRRRGRSSLLLML